LVLKYHNVLNFSAAGISRSSTIIIAFIMKELSLSSDEAFDFVKARHLVTNPNSGFKSQLKLYEDEISTHSKEI
jgi:protein-tyrosine phosphatase